MRKAVERVRPQADLECEIGDSFAEPATAGDAVVDQRLGDDVADPQPRVERRIRVLEHHLQLAAIGPHPVTRQRVDALAADPDLAGGRLDQLEDGLARGRLAAAALADEAQGLALRDVERDAVDGVDLADGALQQPLSDREVLDQVPDREQRHVTPTRPSPARRRGNVSGRAA